MSNPFRSYQAYLRLIDNAPLDSQAKVTLEKVARITQTPPCWRCLHKATRIAFLMRPLQINPLEISIENIESHIPTNEPRRLGTEYPIFLRSEKFPPVHCRSN